MRLNERLDLLAEQGDVEITIAPEDGQDLEAFQASVSFLRDYEQSGYLIITRQHKESYTSNRYVDRLRIKLTPAGIDWRKTNAG